MMTTLVTLVTMVNTYSSITSMSGRLSGSSSPSALASIFTSLMMATDTRRGACRQLHSITKEKPSARRSTSVWSPRCGQDEAWMQGTEAGG